MVCETKRIILYMELQNATEAGVVMYYYRTYVYASVLSWCVLIATNIQKGYNLYREKVMMNEDKEKEGHMFFCS